MAQELKCVYVDAARHKKLKREAVESDSEITAVAKAAVDAFLALPCAERRKMVEDRRD